MEPKPPRKQRTHARRRMGPNNSEELARETSEMEARLQQLQSQVEKEKKRGASSKNGSMRWGSSSTNKGSLKNYSKDIISQHSSAAEDRAKRDIQLKKSYRKATQATRENGGSHEKDRPSTASRRLDSVPVNKWTVDDVLLWLTELGLDQYTSTFSENEITGDVLLEMGTDDLDYLGIKALGHRKMLLKSIRQLQQKQAERTAMNPSDFQQTKQHSQEKKSNSSQTIQGAAQTNTPDIAVAEAAEHEAFKAAVMAWRRGNASAEEPQQQQCQGDWKNPFGNDTTAAQQPSGNFDSTLEIPTDTSSTEPALAGQESEEHSKFVAAVEQWRRGADNDVNSEVAPLRSKLSSTTAKQLGLQEEDIQNKEHASWYKAYNLAFSDTPNKFSEYVSSLYSSKEGQSCEPKEEQSVHGNSKNAEIAAIPQPDNNTLPEASCETDQRIGRHTTDATVENVGDSGVISLTDNLYAANNVARKPSSSRKTRPVSQQRSKGTGANEPTQNIWDMPVKF
eukprot:gb/GECG01005301.1/.p1 GENE.gb/GECG01005301.1/~~gb/GECG01005301.1/.p1  ORF type:complete len:507 (+),score=89.45 gb/GECG01005301.1/:1-1521(+)